MTNLEAIKAKVGFPLPDNAFHIALEGRGLSASDIFVIDENTESFELAYADCLCTVLTSPNISEGGYSVAANDIPTIKGIVDRIFEKYDEPIPVTKPKAKFINRW